MASPTWAATLQVGPTRPYKVPSQAAAVAKDGDTVALDAGVYPNDAAVWSANNLTITGPGAIIQSNGRLDSSGKGIWLLNGNNTTIDGPELVGNYAGDGAAAALRLQGNGLTLRNVTVHHANQGLLTGPGTGTVRIEHSQFAYNGTGDGQGHNIYVGDVPLFEFINSYSHDSRGGQNIKSRARKFIGIALLLVNTRWTGPNFDMDFSCGGDVSIDGLAANKSADANQQPVSITYNPEGAAVPNCAQSGYTYTLTMTNSTIVNNRPEGYIILYRNTPPVMTFTNVTAACLNRCYVLANGTPTIVPQPDPPGITRTTTATLPSTAGWPVIPQSLPQPPIPKSRLVTTLPIPPDPGWYELANTQLRPVCWAGSLPGTEGCAGVLNDWNSGAFDTQRNRLLLWGGGHGGYYGNEMYSVTPGALKAERLTDPGQGFVECADAVAQGTQPAARHTYDGLVYVAHRDMLLSLGGAVACGALGGGQFAPPSFWGYDFTAKLWRKLLDTNQLPLELRQNAAVTAASYDPVSKRVWLATSCLYDYDVDANVLTRHDLPGYTYQPAQGTCWPYLTLATYSTTVIDPDRRLLYIFGAYRDRTDQKAVIIADPAKPQVWNFTTSGLPISAFMGLAYDPIAKHVLSWNGGDTVYSLDVDKGLWTPITFPGGPGPANPNGTFKRWAYVPALDVFMVVNDVDHNAFVWRPDRGPRPVTFQGTLTVKGKERK